MIGEGAVGPVHRPVLIDEVTTWLGPGEGAVLVDGTVGAGGHAAALASQVGPTGRIIGLDRDKNMLALANAATAGLPVTWFTRRIPHVREVLDDLGIASVQGVLLDLGLSSDQLAWGHRGFSFNADGPLDMRFDPESIGTHRRRAAEQAFGCRTWPRASLTTGKSGSAGGSRGGLSRPGETRRSRPPGSLPSWSARAFPGASAMDRSTRRPASSRPCGSWSTTSSPTSTRRSRSCPRSSPLEDGPRSSASTRWKTAASSGPFATTRGFKS